METAAEHVEEVVKSRRGRKTAAAAAATGRFPTLDTDLVHLTCIIRLKL